MPVVEFTLRWPDGVEQRCSSPSTVVHEHLVPGLTCPVPELVARCEVALEAAAERVRARYGFRCTGADEQRAAIAAAGARYGPRDGEASVLSVGGVRAGARAAVR